MVEQKLLENNTTTEDTNMTIDLSATDTDGNALSYTVEVNATANGLIDTKNFELNVTAVDDAPSFTAQQGNYQVQEDATGTSVILAASDVESNPFTYYASTQSDKVTLSLVDNNLTITPKANTNGSAVIDVNVTQDNNSLGVYISVCCLIASIAVCIPIGDNGNE